MDVVRNRVRLDRWPDTYCDVIKDAYQFSWYNDWRRHLPPEPLDWLLFLRMYHSGSSTELASLDIAFDRAREHYLSEREDATYGGTHYLTRSLYATKRIKWAREGDVIGTIGNHVFLKNVR